MNRGSFGNLFRVWLVTLLAPVALLYGDTPAPEDGKYKGFTIDDSRVRDMENLAEVRTATKEQIDIVCAVGLPEEVLTFFKGIPLTIVPKGTIPSGSPGVYTGRKNGVKIQSGVVNMRHKPVLLHEYLHAYHDQRLEQGVKNPDVLKFYEKGKTISAFAANSHMMQNPGEFFACSATTYLYGVTAQEPFKREKMKENQPEMIEHLKTLFGPKAGSYAGSLTK